MTQREPQANEPLFIDDPQSRESREARAQRRQPMLILKGLILTVATVWEFWIHPHYGREATVHLLTYVCINALTVVLFWFFLSKRIAYVLLFPLGTLVLTTIFYAIHL